MMKTSSNNSSPVFYALFGYMLMCALLATSAHAQWAVIDGANLMQNMLTAARSLEEVNNQIQQLENDAQMLRNEGRQLTSLNYSALTQLRTTLATTARLLQEAQGIAYTVNGTDATFARLYPASYSAATSYQQMGLDARERQHNTLLAIHTTLRMQAQAAQNFSSDEDTLGQLVERSQAAIGQLQATQATNQLLALQSRQAIQAQQLRITQDRAVAVEQARYAAIEEQAREQQRRFLGDGARYTSQSVDFYSR